TSKPCAADVLRRRAPLAGSTGERNLCFAYPLRTRCTWILRPIESSDGLRADERWQLRCGRLIAVATWADEITPGRGMQDSTPQHIPGKLGLWPLANANHALVLGCGPSTSTTCSESAWADVGRHPACHATPRTGHVASDRCHDADRSSQYFQRTGPWRLSPSSPQGCVRFGLFDCGGMPVRCFVGLVVAPGGALLLCGQIREVCLVNSSLGARSGLHGILFQLFLCSSSFGQIPLRTLRLCAFRVDGAGE